MNNIEEIKRQNQFDSFTKMYAYVAGALLENGKRGEQAVREALIRYGEERGNRLRMLHMEKGIKTNLKSLCRAENCCGEDPRFYRKSVKDTEEVQLFEVYSCPMEHMWRMLGSEKAGMLYCEEVVHAMMRTYTCGKGQGNLSDLMTCERDNFCRFSLYYRPANLDEEQKSRSFGEMGQALIMPSYDINENFIRLYYYLLSSAKEFMGQDGIRAVAAGLNRLAKDLVKALKKEASHVDRILDDKFMEDFFPLELNMENEALWEQYSGHDAKKLLWVNLIRTLTHELNL